MTITDHETYNEELALSLHEKLFFLDKLQGLPERTLFVDFGCGDGSLLAAIREDFPEAALWGVERDQVQRTLARRHGWVEPTWSNLVCDHGLPHMPRVAIFSSVLHESPYLLEHALAAGFDYIVIRDMALTEGNRYLAPILEHLFKSAYLGTPHWDREKDERYFQLSAEAIAQAPIGYLPVHFEHSFLWPLVAEINERHGYCPLVPTHVKAIWARSAI